MPKHRGGGRTRHAPPELFPKEAVAPGWKVLHEVRRRPLRKTLKPQPEQDAPDRTEKLHLALALGTEHRTAAAVESAEVEMAGPGPSFACTAPPTLAVGCITAPANTDRRGEQRRARDAHLRLHPCAASLTFILGSRRLIPPAQLAALDAEQAIHGDLLFLECTEGSGAKISHGGRAVAEKALGWFVHAANHTASPFVAKSDDDTALSLPRLAADLEALSRVLTLILARTLTPTLTLTLTLTLTITLNLTPPRHCRATRPRRAWPTTACTRTGCGTGRRRRGAAASRTRRAARTATTVR